MGVLVGRQAPDFTAAAVLGNGEIVDSYNLHEKIIEGQYIETVNDNAVVLGEGLASQLKLRAFICQFIPLIRVTEG